MGNDHEAASTAAPLSTNYTTDPMIVRLLQAGGLLMVVLQTIYLWADFPSRAVPNSQAALPFHLLNVFIGIVVLTFTFTPLARRHWRGIAFGAVVAMCTTGTLICIIERQNPRFFISLEMLLVAVAAMIPWEIAWQTAVCGFFLLCAFIHAAWVLDDTPALGWLSVIAAIAMSETATLLNRLYRGELEKARREALAASEAKSGFLSNMSHEIRTPMNAIIGLAEVMRETRLDSEQRRYVDTMLNNGKTLLELINNVLDLAKIESGHLTPIESEFDLPELVELVGDSLAIRAHEKNLELTVRTAPDVAVRVIGDALRLRQILFNLLGNAIKFTDRGEISLSVENVHTDSFANAVRFTISDTGPGIAPDQQKRLFSVFTQLASAGKEAQGTGLGLSIVRRLTELMGGTVGIESEVGEGTRFIVTLPLRPGSSQLRAATDLRGVRVLAVDDNATNRLILRETIASADGIMDEADSGEAALAALRKARELGRPYDLLLVDCRMPTMDGFELVRRLREEQTGAGAAILMLTSDELSPRVREIRESGLDLYLVKPVKRAELIGALRIAMEQRDTSAHKEALQPVIAEPLLEGPPMLPRILLAEDNPSNRMLILAYMKGQPYEVDIAEDGVIAVNKFRTRKYALILMDMHMPEMDGYEAAATIREYEKETHAPRTPIIALTAAALGEDQARAVNAGCDMHLAKPVRKKVMFEAIEKIVAANKDKSPEDTPVIAAAK